MNAPAGGNNGAEGGGRPSELVSPLPPCSLGVMAAQGGSGVDMMWGVGAGAGLTWVGGQAGAL